MRRSVRYESSVIVIISEGGGEEDRWSGIGYRGLLAELSRDGERAGRMRGAAHVRDVLQAHRYAQPPPPKLVWNRGRVR